MLHREQHIFIDVECHLLRLGPFFFDLLRLPALLEAEDVDEHAGVDEVDKDEVEEAEESPPCQVVQLVEESVNLREDLVVRLENNERVMRQKIENEIDH